MSTTIAKQFVNSFAVALSVGIHSNIIRYSERSNQLNYDSAKTSNLKLRRAVTLRGGRCR